MSQIDVKRLKAWKMIFRGENNFSLINREIRLSKQAIKRIYINWQYGGFLILGDMLEPFHTKEEIKFIEEYFMDDKNKGSVARRIAINFKNLFNKGLSLRFIYKILKQKRFYWQKVIKKTHKYNKLEDITTKKHWSRAFFISMELNYFFVMTDDTIFTVKPPKKMWIQVGEQVTKYRDENLNELKRVVRAFYSIRGFEGIFQFKKDLNSKSFLYCLNEMFKKLKNDGHSKIIFGCDNVSMFLFYSEI